MFSTEDVRELIFKRLDECNDQFVQFLEDKVRGSLRAQACRRS